jgi:hypothetical protein
MLHDLYHLPPCILPQDLWKRDQSWRAHSGLGPACHLLYFGSGGYCVGLLAPGHAHCELDNSTDIDVESIIAFCANNHFLLRMTAKLFLVLPDLNSSFLKFLGE